jgi:hypothetical protein
MTARETTFITVDAATVYAEGVLSGLRTACNILGGKDSSDMPPKFHAQVREWRAVVYHNQWLAEHGNPAAFPDLPRRDELLARIHTFLLMFPEFDHAD